MSKLPAHITISNGVPLYMHDDLGTLIAMAAHLADTDLSLTEVHIKQGRKPAHGTTNSPLGNKWYAVSGMAYYRRGGGPLTSNIVRVLPGMHYLVTMRLPLNIYFAKYPYEWHYRRYKTATRTTFIDWHEEVIHLLTHEFRHIHQYTNKLSHSEIDCEAFAYDCTMRFRAMMARQYPTLAAATRNG